MLYGVVAVLAGGECAACEPADAFGRKSEAQGVVEEEVVEFVRADEVFGFLGYGSVGACGKQLGADGGVEDVEQCVAQLISLLLCGKPSD